MALYHLELYLQEGDQSTYAVTIKTSYAQEVRLTEFLPNRELALEEFAHNVREMMSLRQAIWNELNKLGKEVALLRTPIAEGKGAEVQPVSGHGSGVGKGPQHAPLSGKGKL